MLILSNYFVFKPLYSCQRSADVFRPSDFEMLGAIHINGSTRSRSDLYSTQDIIFIEEDQTYQTYQTCNFSYSAYSNTLLCATDGVSINTS